MTRTPRADAAARAGASCSTPPCTSSPSRACAASPTARSTGEAGLPEGSCSAYLRTRRALQGALTEYVAGTPRRRRRPARPSDLRVCPPDDERGVELTARLFLRWLDERELLLARLELSLEAVARPRARRAPRDTARPARRRRGRGDHGGARQGRTATRAAEALVASFDGILFAALLKPGAERRAFLSGRSSC